VKNSNEKMGHMAKKSAPQFPGFARCMIMLRNRKDVEAQEAAYHWLRPRVGEFVEPLIAELEAERDPHMQGWILELLGEARDTRAFDMFAQHLLNPDMLVRQWAETGLRNLGQTREVRMALWDAYHRPKTFLVSSEEHDEQSVRDTLARILDEPRAK